jgi:hypothetical protein
MAARPGHEGVGSDTRKVIGMAQMRGWGNLGVLGPNAVTARLQEACQKFNRTCAGPFPMGSSGSSQPFSLDYPQANCGDEGFYLVQNVQQDAAMS